MYRKVEKNWVDYIGEVLFSRLMDGFNRSI
jgi:hypothetical protein